MVAGEESIPARSVARFAFKMFISKQFGGKAMKVRKSGQRIMIAALSACVAALAAGPATAATSSSSSKSSSSNSLEKMSQDSKQWVMPGGNYSIHRHSKLDQINTKNVKNLKVAWSVSSGALRGHEGQPLIIGDMMYFETPYPNHIYAIDLDKRGQFVWKFTPKEDKFAPSVACCDVVNRGVAYADGKILATTLDDHIYALDAKTGKVLWKAKNGDVKKGQTMTMAPLVIKDHVIVGSSGAEYGVHGHIDSYNLKTGKREWRAYSTGPDKQIKVDPQKTMNANLQKPIGKNSSLKTWKGNQWKLGGGTTWGWYSYDPKLDLLYYGTGNPGTWNPSQRPGANKWSMTIFARDPDTGMAKWAFQMTPHDGWDYDGVNGNVLVDMKVHGKTTPVLVHFDRNGYCYVLNRKNGKLIAVHKYDPTVNWAKSINKKTGKPTVDPSKMTKEGKNVKDICPASEGDKDEQPVSYDPKSGLFYVPTNHICMNYQAFSVKYKAGFPYVGAIVSMYAVNHGDIRGRFLAYNALTGKTKWQIRDKFQDWSGVLTTDGGVAFYGTLTGLFRAVDMKTGKVLYQFKAPSGIVGNPIAYEHNGKEYIAVLDGVGGWAAIGMTNNLTKGTAGLGAVGLAKGLPDYTNLGGVLLVFALPSKGSSKTAEASTKSSSQSGKK
jgi:PQQ-dependent dehydrogenase (methanol/ethanol family)